MSELCVVLNSKWRQLRLLQVALRSFESVLAEMGLFSRRRNLSISLSSNSLLLVFDSLAHDADRVADAVGDESVPQSEVLASLDEKGWRLVGSTSVVQFVSKLDAFRASLRELLEQCEESLLPCWGGGSDCTKCKFCTPSSQQQRSDAWDGNSNTEAFKSMLGEEFLGTFDTFWTAVSECNPRNHRGEKPYFQPMSWHCVPCQLRHLLPQLLSVRHKGGAGRSRPFLCVDKFLHCRVSCKCDMDYDYVYDVPYYMDLHGYYGNWDYSSMEQPNAWRREVREWQREVTARKSIYSHRSGAYDLREVSCVKHRHAKRTRGGRHKAGENATRHGLD